MFDPLDKAMARGYHHFATPMQKIVTIKRMEMGAERGFHINIIAPFDLRLALMEDQRCVTAHVNS